MSPVDNVHGSLEWFGFIGKLNLFFLKFDFSTVAIRFEFDHVDLHPSRRQYLEHLFGTIKSFNGRNRFLLPWLIQIPYYVNIATSRRTDTSSANQAYEVDAGNTISVTASPLITPMRHSNLDPLPDLSLGFAALEKVQRDQQRARRNSSAHSDTHRVEIAPELPLSSFHYGSRQYRVPYLDLPVHKEFRTWSESDFFAHEKN